MPTYTGPTLINAGTLRVGITSSTGGVPDLSPVVIGASGTFDFNGTAASQTETIGSLAGSGTVLNSNTNAKTLAVGGDNTSTTFLRHLCGRGRRRERVDQERDGHPHPHQRHHQRPGPAATT